MRPFARSPHSKIVQVLQKQAADHQTDGNAWCTPL
ncbi:hypothetical protein GGR07_000091 [Bacteroides pyogenes]|nr:hypothetical protein [Bacteroides pyogenes]